MKAASLALYHSLRADFLERVRQSSFLVVMGVTLYFAYLFVPPLDADYLTLTLGNQRGIYNSAWLGAMFGMAASLVLSLFAFYLVKGSIDRDRRTNVGQVIATTPIPRPLYTLGKWLSHLAVLVFLLLVLSLMAIVMQFVRAEDSQFNFGALMAPIWLMGLPVIATVAGAAVLFECISFLRGGFGNVVYFFLWVVVLTTVFSEGFAGGFSPRNDFLGITRTVADMQTLARRQVPDYEGDFGIGRTGFERPVQTFEWKGLDWNAQLMAERLEWLLLAVGLALIAALPFDRFDPARGRYRPPSRAGVGEAPGQAGSGTPGSPGEAFIGKTVPRPGSLPGMLQLFGARGFGRLLVAELRLALRGQPWWWYAVAGLLILAGLASQPAEALENILPFAWIWPLLIWSETGAREAYYFTDRLVFPTPYPLLRQLPASWLAGVIVALLAGSGAGARLLLAGEWDHLAAWLIAALFIPALALALGTMSRTSRLFEMVYLVWWYVALSAGPPLDFMATTEASLAAGTPLMYLGLTPLLIGLAVYGRWRQLVR